MTPVCLYPPDFGGELNSCFDDKWSVRVHGHTRLPLNNKCTAMTNKHQWSVSLHYIVYTRCEWFQPLHKVAEQVYDLLLQSWAVLNNRISFVGDLLLKFLQFLDLLSYLQLWLSQRGDPENSDFEKYKPIHKKVRFKSRFGCERTVYHVSKRSRQMFGGPPMQAICCLLFSRPVLHQSDSSAQSPWQTAALPSQSLFAAKQIFFFWTFDSGLSVWM